MISPNQLKEKLTGYPEHLVADFELIHRNRDMEALNRFLMALLAFLQDSDADNLRDCPPDNLRLREDLNVDSITIAEIVFLLEDIFEVEIPFAELIQVSTVGDLKAYLRAKLV